MYAETKDDVVRYERFAPDDRSDDMQRRMDQFVLDHLPLTDTQKGEFAVILRQQLNDEASLEPVATSVHPLIVKS